MHRYRSCIACLAITAAVSGCATLNKDECLHANWYSIGMEDGAKGEPLERLSEHRRACAEYGVAPIPDRYAAGRDQGLKSYCTYEHGYAAGSSGSSYHGVCPPELSRRFLAGYEIGREIYEIKRKLAEVQSEIQRTKDRLKDGIKDSKERNREVERLERLSHEAAQLEGRLR